MFSTLFYANVTTHCLILIRQVERLGFHEDRLHLQDEIDTNQCLIDRLRQTLHARASTTSVAEHHDDCDSSTVVNDQQ